MYECRVGAGLGFGVDKCLLAEIQTLNAAGVKTIGCCCGQGKPQGYIQVAPESCPLMEEIGYKKLPLDEFGNGQWRYKPKTRRT